MLSCIRHWVLFLLVIVSAFLSTALSAQTGEQVSSSGHFVVEYRSELTPLAINRTHDWILTLTDSEGEALEGASLEISGGMPSHNHGLPTQPRIQELMEGRYRLSGLRFHMPGVWRLELEIQANGVRDRVTIMLEL